MASTYNGKVCAKHPELKGRRRSVNWACVGCTADRARRPENLAKFRVRYREFLRKLKAEVIGHYGGQCKRCGEDDIDVLTLDHKDGDGARHRRELSKTTNGGGTTTYRWAKKHGSPKIFRVLCFNCNVKLHLLRLRRAQLQ